ncbi:MAG: hypothetical protein JW751_22420 [Polyangiaceae bacterium]|nr:hypothetical protein [Polyangiaceae bacterium]
MASDAWGSLAALTLAASLVVYACAKQKQATSEAPAAARAASAIETEDDRSRCAHEGRVDREVEETASSRAIQPNIRRVYAVVGRGDDAHRVLLCREVDQNLDGIKDVVRTYDDDGDPLKEMADTDYDGKIDTWTTFATGRVAELQVDRNRDGQPDEKRVYVHGKKLRAELDDDFDGRTDTWEIYEDGRLQRRGVDIDGDGKVDRWDRDEVAFRDAERREMEAEEKREKERREAEQSEADAGPTDARVSARKR